MEYMGIKRRDVLKTAIFEGQDGRTRRYYVAGTVNKEKADSDMDRLTATAYVMVCGMNDIVNGLIADTMFKLKQTRHYRQKVKMCANKVNSIVEYNNRRLRTVLSSNMGLWMDIQDNVNDEVKRLLDEMLMQYRLVLMTNRVEKDRELFTYLAVTQQMIDLAVQSFDTYFDNAKEELGGIDILRRSFDLIRMVDIQHLWTEMCDNIPPKLDIDFGAVPNCKLAFGNITKRLTSIYTYERALNKTGILNEEVQDV